MHKRTHWTNFAVNADILKRFKQKCDKEDLKYGETAITMIKSVIEDKEELIGLATVGVSARFRFMVEKDLKLTIKDARRESDVSLTKLFEAKMRKWVQLT